MEQLTLLATNFLQLSVEASPWLLLGLIIAGLMKVWVPKQILSKHLGTGKLAIVKAACIGAPLPLCSCGVIPVAVELKRSGASDPATASFLVATPETGVDSISVSYAMLGPIFAIYRPFAAIFSAIITGLLVITAKNNAQSKAKQQASASTAPKKSTCCASKTKTAEAQIKPEKKSCCATKKEQPPVKQASCCSSQAQEKTPAQAPEKVASSCCSSNQSPKTSTTKDTILSQTLAGLRYAATQLIDDLIVWLLVGLIFATLVKTYIPAEFLLTYGSGIIAMLMMIAISIPMYICATASTPIAAGLIMAGISPGTALVFMMAGPATNISTLGMVKKEMGSAVLSRYLIGVGGCAISFGLLLDWLIDSFGINMGEHMQHSHELLPWWFGLTCTIILALLALKPLRKHFI